MTLVQNKLAELATEKGIENVRKLAEQSGRLEQLIKMMTELPRKTHNRFKILIPKRTFLATNIFIFIDEFNKYTIT